MKKLIDLGATNFEWRYTTHTPDRRTPVKMEWEFDIEFAPVGCRMIGHRSESASIRLEQRVNKFAWIYEDTEAILAANHMVEFSTRVEN